jgi:hypothetical protein
MSLDKKPGGGSEKKNKKSTTDLAHPWLNELVSRDKSRRTKNVPLKQTRDKTQRSPSDPPENGPPDPPEAGPPPQMSGKAPNDWGWWIGGFLVGFIMGLTMSLTYGWVLDPHPLPVGPAELTPADKEVYIRLVAAAFFHGANEERAYNRVEKLADEDFQTTLINLTERYIDENRDVRDIRALVKLAGLVGQPSAKMVVFLPTPTPTITPTPTVTPTPSPRPTDTVTPVPTDTLTPTPRPTRTATPTVSPTDTPTPSPTMTPTPSSTPSPSPTPTFGPDSPFGLAASEVVCDRASGGLLRLIIRDRLGKGISGAEIRISWPGGRDTVFTGFKPDIDPGYADFQMEPDETYQVELIGLASRGQTAEIATRDRTLCPQLPEAVEPSWQVVFQQGVN